MHSRRLRGSLVIAAATLAALPAAAGTAATPSQRATPILIGAGYQAGVTVDESGAGHIAWIGPESGTTSLHYCTLPRGASACAGETTIAAPGTSLTRPFVVVDGSTIKVVNYRYGLSGATFAADFVFTSTDGGASFDGGVQAGVNPFYQAALGPGDAVSTVTEAETGGMNYQRVPLDGSSAGTARANLSTDHPYYGAVALLDPNTPLALLADGSSNTQFRRYAGAGDPNDAANWTPPVDIGVENYPHLVSGPAGVFMEAGGSERTVHVRRWNGNGFDSPAAIPDSGGEFPQAHMAEDGSGRLHAVVPQITANGSRLLYATSDDGRTWATRQFAFEPLAAQTYVSVASDHHGFVVWQTGNGSSTQVWALPVGPSANEPTLGKFAGVALVSGTVQIKVPGSSRFFQLRADDVIPVGSIIDAGGGRVRVTTVRRGGRLQSSDFFEGVFKLTQAKTGLTDLALRGGSFKSCGRSGGRAAAAAKAKVVRHLWGDGSGLFRTKGKYAAASIRGTTWDTIDRCDGTLVKVTKGSVVVTDFKRHRKVTVKKGQSYLARA